MGRPSRVRRNRFIEVSPIRISTGKDSYRQIQKILDTQPKHLTDRQVTKETDTIKESGIGIRKPPENAGVLRSTGQKTAETEPANDFVLVSAVQETARA
jgi:hypothetical protein